MSQTQTPRKAGRRGADRGRGPQLAVGVVIVLVLVGIVLLAVVAGDNDGGGSDTGGAVQELMHVHGLEVPVWAEGQVYVATHEGLLRIDANGDWRRVSEQLHDFMGFAAHPSEKGTLYSSGHPAPGSDLANPIGFMASTDGGATWQPRALQGQADFHAMAVHADGEVVYGWTSAGQTGLHRSEDGGHSWEHVSAGGLEQRGGAFTLAVDPQDANRVVAGTETALLASDDKGQSWQPLLEQPVTAVAFTPGQPERMLAYSAAPEGGLLASHDAGETWQPLGFGLEEDAVGHIAVDPADDQAVYLATFAQDLYRTSDGGDSWQQLAEDGTPTDEPAN